MRNEHCTFRFRYPHMKCEDRISIHWRSLSMTSACFSKVNLGSHLQRWSATLHNHPHDTAWEIWPMEAFLCTHNIFFPTILIPYDSRFWDTFCSSTIFA